MGTKRAYQRIGRELQSEVSSEESDSGQGQSSSKSKRSCKSCLKISGCILILFLMMVVNHEGRGPEMIEWMKQINNYSVQYLSVTEDSNGRCIKETESKFLIKDLNQVQRPYLQIQKIMPYDELPICILAVGHEESLKAISSSINTLDYQNFVSVYLTKKQLTNNFEKEKVEVVDNFSHASYEKAIKKNCQKDALIFVTNSPLLPEALRKVNDFHQTYSSWISYSFIDETFQVHTFYRRIFDLIRSNDFKQTHRQYFTEEKQGFMALAMIQLSQRHKKKIQKTQLFSSDTKNTSPISTPQSLCLTKIRQAYQPLFSLAQAYPIDVKDMEKSWKNFNENKIQKYNGYVALSQKGHTQIKGFRGIEYQQLLYLPATHSLNKREILEYEQKYNISSYKTEVPFCITVLNHNNVKYDRTIRAMTSILNLNYTNFHVVFLDDDSDDGNVEVTMKFMKESGFPSDKIVYVQNTERKLATYNIVHGAFSYCAEDDIQMLIDGDDEFIGKQVLKIFNAFYQLNPDAWAIYTSYMSNFFTYGESKPIKYSISIATEAPYENMQKRWESHFMGPVRTWMVKLIKQIPLEYHQFKNGTWFDTMYDDALQYSFFELAGEERFRYYPEINYLYNRFYGDNDDSTSQKRSHRAETKRIVKSYKPLTRIQSLPTGYHNTQIQNLFQRQKNVKFKDYRH